MIYLFCSASRPLYKRDALECTCYPFGHIFRFRYEKKYVHPTILEKPKDLEEQEGIVVFLDTVKKDSTVDFDFFPMRKIKIIRLFTEGLAIYVDFKFGDYIDYGHEHNNKDWTSWNGFFKSLPNRPLLPPEITGRKKDDSVGYFILQNEDNNPLFRTENGETHEPWENLIRRLNKTCNLKDSTFFQILGIYQVKRILVIPVLNLMIRVPFGGSLLEVPIKLKDNSFNSFYSLPMGESVVLKLLFSRPTYSDIPDSRRTLKIKYGADTFVGVSRDIIYSESRYNVENIVLVCKRVFDSIFSTISIEQENELQVIQAPKPFLLTKIKVPRHIIFFVILGVVISTFLVGLDIDAIKFISSWFPSNLANFCEQNAKALLSVGKLIAPMPIAISAYLAFRKLPLK